MSDPLDPPQAEPAPEAGDGDDYPDGPFPWDADPPPEDPDAPRERHDAFTEARKSVFLRALVKTGCITDAAQATGISPRTIYRHQENDPDFFENCRAALRISGTPAEITAWKRAVEGVEQEFACGGQVYVRRRYSDNLLRLLLQGSNPKKYGLHPGFKRKRILKHERKQMEREIRAELAEKQKPWNFEEAIEALGGALETLGLRDDQTKAAAGWTEVEKGLWIPPGYAPIPGWQAAADPCTESDEGGTPRDSM
ncbi:MAG: hypothetical protein QOH47_2202 [Sphingomonadales bacterium]|jgi:hypothetical protein|nr:hypothetical protein [Sphingomonadales bacterium]